MKFFYYHLLLLILLIGCNDSDKISNPIYSLKDNKSILLNKKAIDLYFKSNDTDSLEKSLSLIDSAIKINNDNVYFVNKLNILIKLNKRLQAILLCDSLTEKKKLGYLPLVYQAGIYDKLKNVYQAQKKYAEVIKIINAESNKACADYVVLIKIYLALNDQKKTKEIFSEYKNSKCDNPDWVDDYIKNFKKEEYLMDF